MIIKTFQSRQNSGLCFNVYDVQILAALASGSRLITDHRQQLPVIENYSPDSIQLRLTLDSDLVNNEPYSVNITSTKDDGVVHSIGTVRFSESPTE